MARTRPTPCDFTARIRRWSHALLAEDCIIAGLALVAGGDLVKLRSKVYGLLQVYGGALKARVIIKPFDYDGQRH